MPSIDPTAILQHIARFGIERSESELAALARAANQAGVLPAIVPVLTDRGAAPIARERAAARVAAALVAAPPLVLFTAA